MCMCIELFHLQKSCPPIRIHSLNHNCNHIHRLDHSLHRNHNHNCNRSLLHHLEHVHNQDRNQIQIIHKLRHQRSHSHSHNHKHNHNHNHELHRAKQKFTPIPLYTLYLPRLNCDGRNFIVKRVRRIPKR